MHNKGNKSIEETIIYATELAESNFKVLAKLQKKVKSLSNK